MGERTDSLSTGKLGLVVIHASRRTTLLTSHEFHRDKRRRYGNKSKADCHLWFKIFPLKTPKNYQSICLLFFLRRTVCQQVRSCWWTTTFITHIPRIRGISLAVEPRNIMAAVSVYMRHTGPPQIVEPLYWSFQRPQRPTVPTVNDAMGVQNRSTY